MTSRGVQRRSGFVSPAAALRALGKLGPYTTVEPAAATVEPDAAAVRAWAAANGVEVPRRGRVPTAVLEQYRAAQAG